MRVVKTELGWEIERFCAWAKEPDWYIEPGFVYPTKAQALAAMRRDRETDMQIEATRQSYEIQYAHACGYTD